MSLEEYLKTTGATYSLRDLDQITNENDIIELLSLADNGNDERRTVRGQHQLKDVHIWFNPHAHAIGLDIDFQQMYYTMSDGRDKKYFMVNTDFWDKIRELDIAVDLFIVQAKKISFRCYLPNKDRALTHFIKPALSEYEKKEFDRVGYKQS